MGHVQSSQFIIFADTKSILGEGPVWSSRRNGLYWVDIEGKCLHFKNTSGPVHSAHFDQKISAIVETKSDDIIVILAKEIRLYNPVTGISNKLFNVDPEYPNNRSNDAKCDPKGNLWLGTMDDYMLGTTGKLQVYMPDGNHHTLLENIGISNTLAWDEKNNLFYFADSAEKKMYVFDYSYNNDIPVLKNRKIFLSNTDLAEVPDGSCIDSQGFIWNAKWGGSRVVRYTPDGAIDHIIEIPTPNVTSCCFGGKDMKTLFITTAIGNIDHFVEGQSLEAESGGEVFAVELSVSGGRTHYFG